MKPSESAARFLCMLNSCSGISRLSRSVITWHTYHFFARLLNDDTRALQPARPKYVRLVTTERKKRKQMKDSCRKPGQLQGTLLGINDISGNSTCRGFYFWCKGYTVCPESVLTEGGAMFPSGASLYHHTENNFYCVSSEAICSALKKRLEQQNPSY